MNWLPAGMLVAPIVTLLAIGLIPSRHANRIPQLLGSVTTILVGLALIGSVVAAVHTATIGPLDLVFFQWTSPFPVSLGLYVDALAVVMMALISFIGLIIARYSTTYLLGDLDQGRFFRWMSFTLGATLLLVVSRNLVMFTTAWVFTSFGLHQLLTYYPERSWAIWAARKKSLISRLGDAMLITALLLTYRYFGTTEYTAIFAAAEAIHQGTVPGGWSTALIGILYVLGAMTKSAQFPFHSWLPDTMETPTPVSALMHAGVINAGGFMVIRLSPLISLSSIALDMLAVVGTVTALLGSVVMLTQTSIKRSLAYSTIAQMGFMMLQCGVGAFSAALLHILAHSLYKAYAFLSSGSVLDTAERMKAPTFPEGTPVQSVVSLAIAVPMAAGLVWLTFLAIGIDMFNKSGGPVLGLILTLALTQILWNGLATGVMGLALRSIANAWMVTAMYAIAFLIMDRLVASSTFHHIVVPSMLHHAVLLLVAAGFIGIFVFHAISGSLASRRWVQAIYVHAMNGFYIDIPARRITALFYGQKAPVQ